MAAITSITGIPIASPASPVQSSHSAGGGFGAALKSAVEHVDAYQQTANHAIEGFLHGNGELHNVALAAQRAEMAFDLAVQIRNKVVSAYQEVMKMQL